MNPMTVFRSKEKTSKEKTSKEKIPKGKIFRVRHGVGIVECIILLIVLGISLAAVLTTMGWGSRSYAFAREDLDQRLLLFGWFQAFESIYPGLENNVADASRETTEFLGGTWNAALKEGRFRAGRIQVQEVASTEGVVRLKVKIFRNRGGVEEFDLDRRFNIFSSETVSDDVIGGP
ncbi:MAG: hypothetical protein LBQ90_07275 [Synergistaceae bacterium]|jgi:hypothetical protein|nr:hypothetical protein [Synergistaceae bacterium]